MACDIFNPPRSLPSLRLGSPDQSITGTLAVYGRMGNIDRLSGTFQLQRKQSNEGVGGPPTCSLHTSLVSGVTFRGKRQHPVEDTMH